MSWTKLGDLFVMPMRTDEIPEVWISRDLLHWTRVTLPSAAGETLGVTAVTIGGPGLVAIGEGFSGDATVKASWTSTDGMTWTRVQDAGLTAGQMWLLEATANGEVTFASGRVDVTGFQGSPLDSNVGRRTLVASEGGVTAFVSPSGAGHSIQMWQAIGTAAWRRVALLPHSSGATGLIATQGPRGWLLLGGRRCCTGYAVWTSADGITWQAATTSISMDMNALFADQSGFIAVGEHGTGTGCVVGEWEIVGETWTSSDGRHWHPTPYEAQFNRASINVLIAEQGTLYGLGVRYLADKSPRSTVWTTSLPATSHTGGPASTPAPSSGSSGCGPA